MTFFEKITLLYQTQNSHWVKHWRDKSWFDTAIEYTTKIIASIMSLIISLSMAIVLLGGPSAPLLFQLIITYVVLCLLMKGSIYKTKDPVITWPYIHAIISLATFLLAHILPSSLMLYGLYVAIITMHSILLMTLKSLKLPHRQHMAISAQTKENITVFTLLFIASLPWVKASLLQTLVIPAPLLVAGIAFLTWVSMQVILWYKGAQREAYSHLPSIPGFITLAILGSFFGLAPLAISPLLQVAGLYVGLRLISIIAHTLHPIWNQAWLMDSMIDQQKQPTNLHFNLIYCFIAHLGALILSIASLHLAFTEPKRYFTNIIAHCQFLGTRLWHFLYLQVVTPIARHCYSDKETQLFAEYRGSASFDTQPKSLPGIKITVTGSKEQVNKIAAWEKAELITNNTSYRCINDSTTTTAYLALFPTSFYMK